MDRRSLTALRQVELAPFFHLDQRSISKPDHGVRVFRGAHLLTFLEFRARGNGRRLRVSHLKHLSVSGLNGRFKLAKRPVPLHDWNGQQTETDHESRGYSPTQHDRLERVTLC